MRRESTPLKDTRAILCGTDFSPNAAEAELVAGLLAERLGRPWQLVHVADQFNAFTHDKKGLADVVRSAHKKLRAKTKSWREAAVSVEEKVLTGDLAERAILNYAKEISAALVVVASVSKAAFDRWTLGSVSERVAESVAAPTLVVRAAEPFESWVRGERRLRIFVASDASAASDAAIRWAGELRRVGPCELVVAQVDRPELEQRRLGLRETAYLGKNSAEIQKLLERDLRERVRECLGREQVRVIVQPVVDRPDARLIEMAVEAQADLFVVGTHQAQGLQRLAHYSVSRGVLRHAPMSVACVPASTLANTARPTPLLRRVLVATDFSELGDYTAAHAFSLLPCGGEVVLLHVAPPIQWPSALGRGYSENVRRLRAEQAAQLKQAAARLRKLVPRDFEGHVTVVDPVSASRRKPAGGLRTTGSASVLHARVEVVEDTDPSRAIFQAAERFNAGIICLGSHGRNEFSAALLGSVTREVLALTRRPVLVVRRRAE